MYFKTTRPALIPAGYTGADADPPLQKQPVFWVVVSAAILIILLIFMMKKH